MGSGGATCFHTLTQDARDIPKAEWDEMRFGQLCTSAETFAHWKATIQKLCSANGRCIYKKETAKFFEKVEAVQAKAKKPK